MHCLGAIRVQYVLYVYNMVLGGHRGPLVAESTLVQLATGGVNAVFGGAR